MKKRLLCLIALAFLLCGCTANVNINIKDNYVDERISISETPYDGFEMEDIKQQYRKYIPAFYSVPIIDTMPDEKEKDVEYYNMSGTEYTGTYNAYYQYKYKFKEYKDARSIRNAFRSSEVQYDTYEKTILFTTESSGMPLFVNIPRLTEVRINITTDYKVLETNADSKSGNTYTWVFNKNTKKGVYLLLEDKDAKSIQETTTPKKDDSTNKTDDEKVLSDDEEREKHNNGGNATWGGNGIDEAKSEIEQKYEEVKEKGAKHPGVVIVIALVLFFVVILLSLKIKKA